jgi:mono/diheme cytochrome c family protein
MPAKGGTTLTTAQISDVVSYMVEQGK